MQTFATFDDLYRVLLSCGFGCWAGLHQDLWLHRSVRAEKLAEETGVAFQLTNILRDVKEDAERGRIYLPLDLLSEFGVSVDRVKMLASGAAMEGE